MGAGWTCHCRGPTQIKGKGTLVTYFVQPPMDASALDAKNFSYYATKTEDCGALLRNAILLSHRVSYSHPSPKISTNQSPFISSNTSTLHPNHMPPPTQQFEMIEDNQLSKGAHNYESLEVNENSSIKDSLLPANEESMSIVLESLNAKDNYFYKDKLETNVMETNIDGNIEEEMPLLNQPTIEDSKKVNLVKCKSEESLNYNLTRSTNNEFTQSGNSDKNRQEVQESNLNSEKNIDQASETRRESVDTDIIETRQSKTKEKKSTEPGLQRKYKSLNTSPYERRRPSGRRPHLILHKHQSKRNQVFV